MIVRTVFGLDKEEELSIHDFADVAKSCGIIGPHLADKRLSSWTCVRIYC